MANTLERPIALIVEDRPDTLATRRELFATYGFQAIGAKDFDDALREFRATPTIDVVVTDINLNEADVSDRSGVILARVFREKRPHMPIIAYSGQVDALEETDRSHFDDSLLKAELTVAKFRTKLGTWREQALDYRAKRAASAKNELTRFRAQGPAVESAVEVLRDFLPGVSGFGIAEADDLVTPDEILRREGWRFRLVEAGFRSSGEVLKTGVAVPFWIKKESEGTVAVLHGHSCIYSCDENEDSAVSSALELMFGYFEEFKKDPGKPLGPELTEMMVYLGKVFG